MEKIGWFRFVTGFVLGAIIFGGSMAFASGIIAHPKTATVVIDGNMVDLKGYIIDGTHYFQLRDLGAALEPSGKDFSIVWDGHENRVIIEAEAMTRMSSITHNHHNRPRLSQSSVQVIRRSEY